MGWPKGRPRPNRAPRRIAKTGSLAIRGWVDLVRQAVVQRNATRIPEMSEDNFYRFAGYMGLIGECDDPIALDLFGVFCELLLSRTRAFQPGLVCDPPRWKATRIYYLQSNLGFLPVTRDGLLKVGAALKAAGEIEDVESATFPVDRFVEVALAVPDPDAYVEASKDFGLTHWKIGTVFHPYTHERSTGLYSQPALTPAEIQFNENLLASMRVVR